jgi:patatin-related protein
MAWNGGVSLAVWMGGVAVELDTARRARFTSADEDPTTPPPSGPRGARDTRDLYRALCCAFDRVLVIDILTGASAGGLNGALLAGAIVHRRALSPEFLRERWLGIGSFTRLLRPIGEKQPASFMQGDLFHRELIQTFFELLQTGSPPPGEGPAPVLLDVQATDVLGTEQVFVDDWHQRMYAREYRAPMKFRQRSDYTAATLAAAARASASFPAAFEPQRIRGAAARLASLPGEVRWAIDGGLLENAPIRPAIELVPTRRARRPVNRFVCYVNAAPTAHADVAEDPESPTLRQVLSYTFNLPRVGREIDQLQAIAQARHGAGLTATSGLDLLQAGRPSLQAAATALLPTYSRRRAELSLAELLAGPDSPSGPGLAEEVLSGLDNRPKRLPWIPPSTRPPAAPEDWSWGIRAAQRILRLELDVLEAALSHSDSSRDADKVFAAREKIDDAFEALEELYEDFVRPGNMVWLDARRLADNLTGKVLLSVASRLVPGLASDGGRLAFIDQLVLAAEKLRSENLRESTFQLVARAHKGLDEASARAAIDMLSDRLEQEIDAGLGQLAAREQGNGVTISSFLRAGTEAFYEVMLGLTAKAKRAILEPSDLFGPTASTPTLQERGYQYFLGLALAIEVIRRSFSDDFPIEAAQPMRVAQLTPRTPAPLFTSKPLVDSGPSTGEDKLTGIRLVHFAGFYRASWRANDFFWGRLDGAARGAQLLVDADRARAQAAHGQEPWITLAEALVPDGQDPGDPDRRKLLQEVVPELEGVQKREPMVAVLAEALRADLATGDGRITTTVYARALQYEILREELPALCAQADVDRGSGAFKSSFSWDQSPPLWNVIEDLRNWKGEGALPRRLGRDDPDEGTSALALRTIGQAALVGLAALAGVVPLGRTLQPARVPLMVIVGMTARRLFDRVALVVAFAGAECYAVARWLTIAPDADRNKPSGVVPLEAVWSPQVLALWVALLAVAGVVLIPAVRAKRTTRGRRRLYEIAVAAALAATVGVALGWQWASHGTVEALTTWHATYAPPRALLWSVVAVGGVQGISSIGNIARAAALLQQAMGRLPAKWIDFLVRHARLERWVSPPGVLLGGLGGALAVWSAQQLYPAWDRWGWPTAIVTLSFAGPVFLAIYLKIWRRTPKQGRSQ